ALEYNAELFRAATIARMVERFQRLLEGIAAHPEQRMMDLPLMREEERRQVLEEWNATEEPVREACLHELFEEQARRTPDGVAVSFEGKQLTYQQLECHANQLAHCLRERGVGPDVVVGLCMERGVELVVGMLGILKAGGAWLPLDPAQPMERLGYMLSDTRARVLVTQKRLAHELPSHGEQRVLLDVEWEQLTRQPRESPRVEVGPENLAYVIYTSGSTGRPKGVLVEHRSIRNTLHRSQQECGMEPGQKLMQFASIGFDASVQEMFLPLLNGGTLVFAPPEALLPGPEMARFIQGNGITHLVVATPVLAALPYEEDSPLRTLVVGGEACPAELVDRWEPGRRFIQQYGPTEASVATASMRCEAGKGKPPFGKPYPNTRLYVLDRKLEPVPVGVPGELYIGGAGVGRGYLGRPELTAGSFIPDPFSARPGSRLYRTGDVVRYRADGNLEFVGRADGQVKVRGFRIELGEVEVALTQHPGLREVVVVAREDVPGSKRRVAYVVPGGQQTPPGVEELRSFLEGKLPEYMVPAAFVTMKALPLTIGGKVDRRARPAPDWSRPELQGEYVAPQTSVEKQLAAIWAQVLRLERVGRHDNFFSLGGDSIIGMQILARAHQAGLRFTSKQLFQHQTLAELAPVVTEARGQAEQGVITGPVPLTPIQHWFMEQQQPQPHQFKQGMVFEVTERVEPALLERALGRLIEHHDALRMCFVQEAGQWRQVNGGQAQEVSLRRVDLASVPEAQRGAAIEAVAEELPEGFELSRGQLLRAALLDLGEGRNGRLLLVIHHFVVDFVSWRVLLEDLNTAYQQLRRGEEVVLPPKTTSFKTWAERLEAYAQGPQEEELAYWLAPREQGRALPVDRTGGANTQESARGVTLALEAEQTRALLQEVPGAYRVHINDVLLTALAQALAHWTGSRQVLMDMEGHGREELFEDVNLSRTVGWFTTVFPMQLDLSEATDPASALGVVREEMRRLPQRGMGYGLLRYLRKDGAAQGLKSLPRAEVSFNYWGQIDLMGQGSAPFVLSPESGGAEFGGKQRRPHLLAVEVRVFGGRLEATWLYSENVHERATIEALAQGFMTALRALISGRTSPEAVRYVPSDFPLARLDRAALELVLKQAPRVEDLYPLSPLQQGLLYHAHLAPGTDLYFEQLSWAIPQELDVPTFQKAWERVVAQNPILRTAFLWEGLAEPVQVVLPSVVLPWRQLDWRGVPAAEQKARLASLVREDRARGFELSRAPLMRVALVRVDEAAYHCLFSFHHMLLDGWSVGLVFQELYAHYEALASGKELPLKRGTAYREFISWLRRQDAARSEAYWRQALEGFTAPTPLPYDQRSGLPAEQSRGYGERRFQVGTALAAALQAFVRQHHLTLNTLVLAAWSLVLGRHGGVTDVVIGATLAGRPPELPGADAIMGLLINTLPVRVRLEPRASLLPWLQCLQAGQDELRQHEHSPLTQVQAWSEVPRGTSLFDSLYSFENYPMDEALGNAEFIERTHLPLVVSIIPNPRGLLLKIAFEFERFEVATIDRLLAHWNLALERMVVAQPEQPLAALSLLSEGERRQVLEEWNRTGAEYPRQACIHRLFEEQVERAAGALAVKSAEARVSYGELNTRANQVAHWLRGQGVGPEQRVVLCVERSVELVVGALGILKAGGAYVPVDPTYPAERLRTVVGDSRAKAVVTQGRLKGAFEGLGVGVVCMDEGREELETQERKNPESGAEAENLAYVIYTSGSTGKPKGVEVSHASLGNLVAWHQREYEVKPEDRATQVSGPAFDASVWELWPYLTAGASLHVPSDEVRAAPGRLLEWMAQEGVTLSFLPTPLAEVVLGEEWPEGLALRALLTGGDRLHRRPRQGQNARLMNHYGPTENTVVATWAPVVGEAGTLPPIGRPVSNAQAYVLDEGLNPVPVGVSGELYIGGESLARGYLDRPELTAERFIPNPFSGKPGTRLYRTGDVVRWSVQGELEFIGRADSQVKVRGFRIELGEIEAVLAQHAGVREAVVVAWESAPGVKQLVAYVVARQEGEADAGALRAFLKERLPEYMVPSAFMLLEALPLTPNGKVDRRALPAPVLEGGERRADFVEPRTEMERKLAEVWASVLKLPRIGVHDNFFELGGDSIRSMQIVAQAHQAGLKVTSKQLFQHQTIAELAPVVVDARGERVQEPVPLVRLEQAVLERVQRQHPYIEDIYPLSPVQQGMLFHALQSPEQDAYFEQAVWRLGGALDIPVFRRAWQAVVDHNPILRTGFFWGEVPEPLQVVHPHAQLPWQELDWRGLSPAEQHARVESFLQEDRSRGFELSRSPLMRVTVIRMGESDSWMVWSFHHMVLDGWSMSLMLKDLSQQYEAFVEGRQLRLPRRPDFREYIAWMQRQDSTEARAWWTQELKGFTSPTPLPGARSVGRTGPESHTHRELELELSGASTAAVQAFARKHKLTVNTVAQAAWALVLGRYSGESEVLFGSTVAGRPPDLQGVDEMMGMLINTLPVRVRLSAEERLLPWLRGLQAQQLEQRQYQHCSLVQLQKWSDVPRETPLFDSIFTFDYPLDSAEKERLGLLDVENFRPSQRTNYLLTATVGFLGGNLELRLAHEPRAFDAAIIDQVLVHWKMALESIVANPEQRVAEVQLLTEAERRRLVVELNDTRAEYPRETCVHHLFEAQAARTPDAVAVVSGSARVTYGALNRQANQLAHLLRR
ncbi:non-ribosomal peptide synthetase, partial [Archangium sp.]|uniref:non-ribosomal peptide synthetase n=1 Tax=Archangium sp. TaxID=1872627 RepID=UPI002D357730